MRPLTIQCWNKKKIVKIVNAAGVLPWSEGWGPFRVLARAAAATVLIVHTARGTAGCPPVSQRRGSSGAAAPTPTTTVCRGSVGRGRLYALRGTALVAGVGEGVVDSRRVGDGHTATIVVVVGQLRLHLVLNGSRSFSKAYPSQNSPNTKMISVFSLANIIER